MMVTYFRQNLVDLMIHNFVVTAMPQYFAVMTTSCLLGLLSTSFAHLIWGILCHCSLQILLKTHTLTFTP